GRSYPYVLFGVGMSHDSRWCNVQRNLALSEAKGSRQDEQGGEVAFPEFHRNYPTEGATRIGAPQKDIKQLRGREDLGSTITLCNGAHCYTGNCTPLILPVCAFAL